MLKINIILIGIAILAAGCASSGPPGNWLPETVNIPSDYYGGWLIIDYVKFQPSTKDLKSTKAPVSLDDEKTYTYFGEFITYDKDSVYILNEYAGLEAFPKDKIKFAKLELDQKQIDNLWTWGILGSVSTLTHGWFLIISLPVWLISTGVNALGEGHRDIYKTDKPDGNFWIENLKFARFPQGLPKGVDIRKLNQSSKLY